MYIKTPVIRLIRFRNLCAVLFLISLNSVRAQNQFSREQVLEDLDFLKASLEETHYDLYAYTPKSEFLRNFNTVKTSVVKDSFSLLEATSLLQRVISKANNGHTEIDFPGRSYIEYAQGGGTVFPLELAFENGKALVRKNWSGMDGIQPGDEVLSINGVSMADILSRIYPQVSAERPYFKNTKIELYSFPRYYWQVFGRQDSFEVGIRSDGTERSFSLQAVQALEGYEMKREETVSPKRKLEFYGGTAYLNPGSFGGEEDKYRRFIDAAFSEINVHKSKNLIVDLRNNPGGEDSFSDYLVSWFADKPFKWNSSFTLKTSKLLKEDTRENRDTSQAYWKQVLGHENGEIYEYAFEEYQPQPEEKRFSGNVYVLINRQSHSQAAVTAAQIQDNGFGILVGEETGDYPSLFASVFRYTLPNTGISVQVAKGHIVRVNGSRKQQGVIPDIFIKDHLLDGTDEILQGLLTKLNAKK